MRERDGGGVATEVRLGLAAAGAGGEVGGEADAGVPLEFGEVVYLFKRAVGLILKVFEAAGGFVVSCRHPGVEPQVALPFLAETQQTLGHILDIHHLVGRRHDVVAVEVVVALARGLELVGGIEAHAAVGAFVDVAVLVVEGVGVGEVGFGSLVAETVGHITLEEVARAEVGLGHAAKAYAPAFLVVVADDVEHGSDVELAIGTLARSGDIAAGQHFAGGFEETKFGQAAELDPHAVEHRLLGAELHGAELIELALETH